LIHLGTYYGRSVVKEAKVGFSDPQGVLGRFKAMTVSAGWGQLSIRWKQGDERNLEVELKNCVFCSEQTHATSCYFLQGVVAGAISETFGREYTVTETECCRRGTESCKLSATQAAVRETPGVNWAAAEAD
jgi:predicted hydrocarbon binding protein